MLRWFPFFLLFWGVCRWYGTVSFVFRRPIQFGA